jgi:hypothetical protein
MSGPSSEHLPARDRPFSEADSAWPARPAPVTDIAKPRRVAISRAEVMHGLELLSEMCI